MIGLIVNLNWEDFSKCQKVLSDFDNETNPVETLMRSWFQKDLAAASGLNTSTLRSLEKGKKATKAQLAALKFAVLKKGFDL